MSDYMRWMKYRQPTCKVCGTQIGVDGHCFHTRAGMSEAEYRRFVDRVASGKLRETKREKDGDADERDGA